VETGPCGPGLPPRRLLEPDDGLARQVVISRSRTARVVRAGGDVVARAEILARLYFHGPRWGGPTGQIPSASQGRPMFGTMVRRWTRTEEMGGRLDRVERQLEIQLLLLGKQLNHTVRNLPDGSPLQDAEFKVFSQFGDDGIIQFLLSAVPVSRPWFVEFGVEDYREATTRFLLQNDNWCGLVMDGSAENVASIKRSPWYAQHELTAKAAWVTAENINELLTEAGFTGPLGLLHIDVDGNELHLWNALEVADPDIVILEYNAILGPDHALTIPYDPAFDRRTAHSTWLYFGASLRALVEACARRGYGFVGCNSAGNNAYFVRRTLLGRVREVSIAEGFVMSRFRESRGPGGQMSFLTGGDRLAAIRDARYIDLERDEVRSVGDIFGLGDPRV